MQYVTTSVRITNNVNIRGPIQVFYHCVTYLKGFPNKVVFTSGVNTRRDDAVQEVLQFLSNHPQYINNWIN